MRGRFGYVDALRGIAIVAMVLYELGRHGVITATGLAGHLLQEGSRGIDLFFVISGFALAYPALSVLRADGRVGLDLGRYAIRRVARILPASWITIACLAIAPGLVALVPHPTYTVFIAALPPAGEIVREIFFVQAPPSSPDAFWAVSIAMLWYVLFPGLLLLWTTTQRGFLGLGVALVVFGPLLHVFGGLLGELPAFMLGIVAADWRVRHFGFARWALYLAVASAMLGFALEPPFHAPLLAFGRFAGDNVGWQGAAFFLLTGIGHSERAERTFDRAFFATAGSVSFSLALVVESVTTVARPFIQHISTLGVRVLGRAYTAQSGGLTGRISHALAPGTPVEAVLAVLFVALSVLVAGLLLYRIVDRSVFERDPRMRLADRLEPLLSRLFGLMRTTGVLVLGKAPEDVRFEASATGASEFYAPPPRGEKPGQASVTKRSGSPQDLEQEMIAAKKRLAERTTAMFADAEYEANRAKGIVTAAPGLAYPPPPPGIIDATAPVYGEARDVWQKPRSAIEPAISATPATPPAPATPAPPPVAVPTPKSLPVVLEARPDDDDDAPPPHVPRPAAPAEPARASGNGSVVAPQPPAGAGSSPASSDTALPKRLSTSPPAARPKPASVPVPAPIEPAPTEPVWNTPSRGEPPSHEPQASAPPLLDDPDLPSTTDEPAQPSHAVPLDADALDADALDAVPLSAVPPDGASLDTAGIDAASVDPSAPIDVAAANTTPESPPTPRASGPIRFKIGGGPPGTNSTGEKSP